MSIVEDWPHQVYAVEEIDKAIENGEQRICIASNTGSGKSRIMLRVIEKGLPTVVYANRTMLIEQLSAGMTKEGVRHGMQASGYEETIFHNVQVASVQTVGKRWADGKMHLHPARVVIVDEAHNEKGPRLCRVLDEHVKQGAIVILFTATPVGIGHMCDRLIVASKTSQLRECGALLPAKTYAPDEPSWKAFKPKTKGILQFRDEVKDVMMPTICGSVIKHYWQYNPDQKPAILFAPGVSESQWFAEQLWQRGITAAHIDAKKVWINGESMPTTPFTRELLKQESEDGGVKVICNRFVLREGIDMPWLYHCIFACTFGSLSSYIQAGGRVLRNHPSLDHVLVSDHGGNYHRFDSLNVDREWSLEKDDADYQRERAERIRKHNETNGQEGEPEPLVCPKCSKVRSGGVTCPSCGFTYKGKTRRVVQTDGTLAEVSGDIYRPRRTSNDPEDLKAWKQAYFRCKQSGRTFAQARGLFMRENHGKCPNPKWDFMPKRDSDWNLPIKDVPSSRLVFTPKEQPHG